LDGTLLLLRKAPLTTERKVLRTRYCGSEAFPRRKGPSILDRFDRECILYARPRAASSRAAIRIEGESGKGFPTGVIASTSVARLINRTAPGAAPKVSPARKAWLAASREMSEMGQSWLRGEIGGMGR